MFALAAGNKQGSRAVLNLAVPGLPWDVLPGVTPLRGPRGGLRACPTSIRATSALAILENDDVDATVIDRKDV